MALRFVLISLLACVLQAADSKTINNPLRSPDALTRRGAPLSSAKWKGRDAVRFVDERGSSETAVFKILTFHNGTIEVDVAAQPAAGAPEGSRGFAGLAFRLKDERTYEAFYLRPTNGRADDQLRRNHSTQYISEPEWPWQKLRQEMPGVYESYVDLEPSVWTHMKIVVKGSRAELFVGGAAQPCLIVKDLKKGDSDGSLALWIGQGTEAYFSNFKVTPAP
ncbi:MAG: hypothetical protein ABI823_13135 [Bryobacteraceae bacterium]